MWDAGRTSVTQLDNASGVEPNSRRRVRLATALRSKKRRKELRCEERGKLIARPAMIRRDETRLPSRARRRGLSAYRSRPLMASSAFAPGQSSAMGTALRGRESVARMSCMSCWVSLM